MSDSAGNRSLKIGVNVDSQGTKAFSQSLNELRKKSDDLDKGIKSLNKSLAGLGKAVADIAKSLKDIQKGLGDTSKGAKSQAKDIDQLTSSIQRLNQAVGGGGGRGGPPGMRMLGAGGSGGPIIPSYVSGGMPPGGTPWAQRVTPFNTTLNAPPGGGYNGPPPGSPIGGWPPSNPPNPNGNFNAAAMTAAVGAAVREAGSMFQEFKTKPYENLAQLQSFREGLMRNIAAGNIYDLAVMSRPGMRNNLAIEDVTRESGGKGTMAVQVAGKLLQNIGVGGGIGDKAGGGRAAKVGAAVGALSTVSDHFKDTVNNQYTVDEANAQVRRNRAEGDKTVYAKMLYENIAQVAGSRLTASRRLGGQELNIAGAGLQAGMSPTESFGAAMQGANRFGASAMVQGGLFRQSSKLLNYGFNQDTSLGILGNLQQTIGGNKAASGAQASQQLETIFKDAFAGGLRDVALAEEIGKAVSSSLSGPGGFGGDATMLGKFLSAGLTGDSTMAQIQGRVSGLEKIGGGGLAGIAPALEGIRAETLKNMMGSNFDPLALDVLLKASPQELIKGSADLDNLGLGGGINSIADPQVRRLREEALFGSSNVMMDRLTTGSNLSSHAVNLRNKMQKAGSWQSLFKKDHSARSMAGTLVSTAVRQGAVGQHEAEGFFDLYGQGGAISGKGTLGKQFSGGASKEQKFVEAMTSFQMMVDSSKPERLKAFSDAAKVAIDAFNGMKEQVFNDNDTNVTLQALTELIKTIQGDAQTTEKIQNITKTVIMFKAGKMTKKP